MQLIFASITLYCSLLLCDCYRYPQPDGPERNYTYSMVRMGMGMLCNASSAAAATCMS